MCIGGEIRLLKRERGGEGGEGDVCFFIVFLFDIFNVLFLFDVYYGLYIIVDEVGKICGKFKIFLVFR